MRSGTLTRRLGSAAFLVSFSLGLAASAAAQAPLIDGFGGTVDYGDDCLSPNDDGSSAAIDLTPAFPAGLRFFDRTHTTAYVNTNGNITFSGPLSTFTPRAFPVADQPMIAPYWGDVDIRRTGGSCMGSAGRTCTVCAPCHDPSENGVWWTLEPGRMVVTWDRVGYYSCNNDRRMSFQLILTAVPGCGGVDGDFDVEFRYNRCEWETGDASGGTDGFGGTEAQAGFDAGNEMDFVAIMGSREAGIANRLCMESNVGETGIWRFQIRGGTVVCPDAGMACDTGMEGVCGEGRTNCVGAGTECQPILTASDERCDALDNDCDGSTDEGDALCPGATAICDRGVCVDVCFEGGCGEGEVCSADGRCVDAACEDVTCGEGERCVGGSCVGACDGVSCPRGQECQGGRCVDVCERLSCDPECQVCSEGACVGRCELTGCEEGEVCQDDGHCVDAGCASMTCPDGSVCEAGSCIDACEGAVCPMGESCVAGECVRMAEPPPGETDAGPSMGTDAGMPTETDGGSPTETDAGSTTGEEDAGRTVPGSGDGAGCACRTPTGEGGPMSAGLLLVTLGALLRRRRG
ncbi:MAG TPA: nidogen-like domain-containing protein [Polyangiaceae bacterium LLY-WYZ-15_(1-7)]|nr:nidogen-like domain-containing protein [Polyangiaceae bacterium LLY-WYZ-15_(1-7)]HJL03755.1 nidogen-like domain-containing protein [Polyangiaceae bacterium LLY-WYZ-15_(1-7)]HJL08155.1 nidogen-like domain-containing protein [Polyangiaceae bacterium LLY-WYZ-15_(1-7)]HJL21183.1 nidogen-like domain-containing protein [Polyangiaceae bacterium LLY-WYZ-15_(1-7)]HJL34393.1 nidogen-like domain-containing protein [Polyangiaceae bacterium LLY-WYZ-15_(1-7)]